MTAALFGTDGIRGKAGEEPLTPPTLKRLGRILARRLAGRSDARVLLGHDGRESGETLAAAVVQGLGQGGVHADVLGLAPTPAVAYLTRAGDYALGVVISASHNPAEDNGIKLLASDGAKLDDDAEREIEEALLSAQELPDVGVPGETRRAKGLLGDYVVWLRNEAFPELDLSGWRVAIDCANGAYSRLGPRAVHAFGAEVVAMNDKPDGHNINRDCGALHPEHMARATVENRCHIGLSVDGDGDRGMLADSTGRLLDGDALLAGHGRHLAERGVLPGDTVVATVMSNLALERYLHAAGVRLERVPVGDRNVAAAMRAGGFRLGGEKSGHLLFGEDHDYRGDGLYTLLRTLAALQQAGCYSWQFAEGYRDLPQKLVNLPVLARRPLEELPELSAGVRRMAEELGDRGRIVVRFSGTELRLRLMAEADSEALVDHVLDQLAAAARRDGILT